MPVIKASEISLQMAGGVEKISSFSEDGITYFSMSQLASLLGDRLDWERAGLSIKYKSDRNELIFFIGSPFIRTNDSVANITYPAILRNGQLYLPAITFIQVFDRIRIEQISWNENDKIIRFDSEWYTINDLTFSPKANGLLIEIFVSGPTNYEIFPSDGNWINITIPGGTINQRQILSHKSSEFLLDLNAYQLDGSAQLSLRLRRQIGKIAHRFQPSPDRIQISMIDTLASIISNKEDESIGPDKLIDRIILDAGHGGSDFGAIGQKSSREKDIVLDIAKRLAKLIRKEKIFEVVLTREKDEAISLQDRTKKANDEHGDIFVSIHANASLKKIARGFQVFFLAPAKNDSARAVAQLENAPFLSETGPYNVDENDEIGYIISDMIQTEFQVESADLAAMVDKEFRRSLAETSARGIDQAGFYVLNGVFMPSILVETAFLTNREDEDLLNDKDFKQKVAESIYEGLKRFKAKYENN
jgi:N-acetylmuramoyl-L-alanine amidase